jgi:IS5 family transposase
MERQLDHPTLGDQLTQHLGSLQRKAVLDQLEAFVPWGELVATLRVLDPPQPKGGRPRWPLLLMVKALFVQKLFNLSDPGLEDALRDSLAFRRFLGLSLSDAVPDETTFVRFRQSLREWGLDEALFERGLAALQKRGLVVQTGSLVDASILEAPRGRKFKEPDGTERTTRDPEGSFTKKHGRTYFGFKAHVRSDRRGLITGTHLSTAKDHDSVHLERLLKREGVAVVADSAYMSQDREAALRARGVIPGIVHRRVRGQAELDPVDQCCNRILASLRAPVEHVFARLKQRMGWRRVRYRGLARNATDLRLMSLVHNFAHAGSLAPR